MKENIVKIKTTEAISNDFIVNESIINNDAGYGNLMVIIGRPGTGKTNLSLKIVAKKLLSDKNKVLFIQLEKYKKEIIEILKGYNAQIDYSNLSIIDNPLFSIEELESNLKEDSNIKTVIIDYLQLLMLKDNESFEDIMLKLKMIKEKFKINIIVTSQINHTLEMNKYILDNADNIIFIDDDRIFD